MATTGVVALFVLGPPNLAVAPANFLLVRLCYCYSAKLVCTRANKSLVAICIMLLALLVASMFELAF